MLPNPKWVAASQPNQSLSHFSEPGGLEIVIPFTTLASVQRSVYHAETLCCGLHAFIRIVRTIEVPYPLELEAPQVTHSAIVAELNTLQSTLPLLADIRLCREWKDALLPAVPPSALVVMSYQRRILRTPEEKLAGFLRKAGHQVSMFLEDPHHA